MTTPELEDLQNRAKRATETEHRIHRWLMEGGVPSPAVVRMIRETMGLSHVDFAERLGFAGINGYRTVMAFEDGIRNGDGFAPTPACAMTMRAIAAAALAFKAIGNGQYRFAQDLLLLIAPENQR